MAKKKLTSICRRHERSLLGSLERAGKLGEKDVHKLRVNVKNLRVLLHLHREATRSTGQGKKLRKLVSPLFVSAGQLRSATLNLDLTKSYRNAPIRRFRELMRQRREEAAGELKTEIGRFNKKKFEKFSRAVASEFKKWGRGKAKKEIEEHLRTLFAEIRADVLDAGDEESLHEIRKKLKVIRQMGAVADEVDPEHPFRADLSRVAAIYERIGNWHDKAELLAELESFLKAINDPLSAQKAAPYVLNLRRQCNRARRHLEKRLKVELLS